MNRIGFVFKSLFCKHNNFTSSSCPFTGYTYTDCGSCGKRIKVEKTNS